MSQQKQAEPPNMLETSPTSDAAPNDDALNKTPSGHTAKNWLISPEVCAKIMTGRLFAEVPLNGDADCWPDLGFPFWASKWPELYELLDDDKFVEGSVKNDPVARKKSEEASAEQRSLASMCWMEWDEMLRKYLRGFPCYQAVSSLLKEKEGCEEKRRWSLDDFWIGRSIGKGAFGTVYVVQERKTRYLVALKVMEKDMIMQRKCSLQIRREIELQFFLLHKNICRLFDYFHDVKYVYLILEYSPNNSLAWLLKSLVPNCLPEVDAARFMGMLASALAYIHSLQIIHRDIKPDNLLLGRGNVLKVADFGWAAHEKISCTAFCGTEEYIAPEMLRRVCCTTQLDMWSAGVVLYEMLVGRTPFRGASRAETFQNIMRGDEGDWIQHLEKFEAKLLVKALMKQEPTERMDAEQVLQTEWFRKYGLETK